MYTKDDYKNEIQKFISVKGYHAAILAKHTYKIYLEYIRELDNNLRNNLLDIAAMESGPEYEMMEDEFNEYLNKM